ncbi:hypothetical protein [Vibrio algivorus]|uniref:DUF1073 domain-containing protein n=1 Tax=Vibrio algivorus TaxID=1667024 RepID=A0ABQ6ELN1_9VIBR|nr:hypothetical protein [Vibrio algivorus]GLT13896.1 hypothetical protein GCM10007931_08700 [Vibrio algivorus]
MGLYDDPDNKAGSPESPPDKKSNFEVYYNFIRAKSPENLPVITEFDPFALARTRYIEIAIRELYSRIMYTTLDIVSIPDEIGSSDFSKTVYDTHSPKLLRGLMHYIVEAMADEQKIVLRKRAFKGRTNAFYFEEKTNSTDLQKENQLDLVTLDFEEFHKTELLEAYFGMVFDAIVSAAKLIRIGGSVVLKVKDLSDLISDKEVLLAVETQVKQINLALKEGKGAYLDSESDIKMPTVDMKPTKEQLEYAYSLICNATGRPMSFVNGQLAGGLSTSGEGDRKQNRQASIFDFNQILRGVLESVFGADFEIKPDTEQLTELSAFMNSLEMTSLYSNEEKRKIMDSIMPLADLGVTD